MLDSNSSGIDYNDISPDNITGVTLCWIVHVVGVIWTLNVILGVAWVAQSGAVCKCAGHIAVTSRSHCGYLAVTSRLHRGYIAVTSRLHRGYTALHQSHGTATSRVYRSLTVAYRHLAVTSPLPRRYTAVTPQVVFLVRGDAGGDSIWLRCRHRVALALARGALPCGIRRLRLGSDHHRPAGAPM